MLAPCPSGSLAKSPGSRRQRILALWHSEDVLPCLGRSLLPSRCDQPPLDLVQGETTLTRRPEPPVIASARSRRTQEVFGL